jgi:hypothetical protein
LGRQIVNTGGQGLASSEAVKFAGISIVAAVVILLVFFFLDQGTKNRPDAYQGPTTSGSAMGAPNPQAS